MDIHIKDATTHLPITKLTVDLNDTIEDVKKMIRSKAVRVHELKFEDEVMVDNRTLSHYKVGTGSTIFLVQDSKSRPLTALPKTKYYNEPQPRTGPEGAQHSAALRAALDYDSVKTHLQDRIRSKRKVTDVSIDPQFFRDAHYSIISKGRDANNLENWLVSEQNTYHKNLSNKETTFSFKSCYESVSSISSATSKGWAVGVGGNVGAGFGGATVGVSPSVQFSKSKTKGEGRSTSESKELAVEIPVPPNVAVTVKELVYLSVHTAECVVKLTVASKAKVQYTYGKPEKTDSIEIKQLEQEQEKQEWIERVGDVVTIKFRDEVKYSFTERKLETSFESESESK